MVDFLLLEPQAVARSARTGTTSSSNAFLTATSGSRLLRARPYLRDIRRRENLEVLRAISRSGRQGAVADGARGVAPAGRPKRARVSGEAGSRSQRHFGRTFPAVARSGDAVVRQPKSRLSLAVARGPEIRQTRGLHAGPAYATTGSRTPPCRPRYRRICQLRFAAAFLP